MFKDLTLGVIGAGNMGRALIGGAVADGVLAPDQIIASDLQAAGLAELAAELGIGTTQDNHALVAQADILLLAIKPQGLPDLMTSLAGAFRPGHVIISVLAGITTRGLEDALGRDLPVVRVMPNTPSLVRAGMSAYCTGRFADDSHAALTAALLASVGESVRVPESLMDPVTAVSGSGPAYLFYLAEAWQAAAQNLGMEPALARTLVNQTILGAAKLLDDSTESAATLRRRVTSKGGTTAAALKVLEDADVADTVNTAIAAACARAQELGRDA